MGDLQAQLRAAISERQLFVPGQRILVAVSGGVDSMALVHVLCELAVEHGWRLHLAHLNHRLRGSSSLADEKLVRRTARDLKLPLTVEERDVRGFARANKVSIEMAARKLRHEFLAKTAVRRKISSVALAHHLDDQIELFFLRLLRGAGSEGLGGMKWRSPSPANRGIELVRPLLDVSKESLQEYASRHRIAFRNDSSNASMDFQRNQVRHELLPLLREKYQPGLSKTVLRVMDILEAESAAITNVAANWFHSADLRATKRPSSVDVEKSGYNATAFEHLPIAIQRRCIQLKLQDLGIAGDYDLIEHLRLYPNKPVEVGLGRLSGKPAGANAGRDSSAVRLVRQEGTIAYADSSPPACFEPDKFELELVGEPRSLEWRGVRFAWKILSRKGDRGRPQSAGMEVFDADKVGAGIILRHWRRGDRFQPIGANYAAKLQDLFVNQKVPQKQRYSVVLATTLDGELFWVEGLRISERFKLTNMTIRRLHWAWRRL